MAEAISMIEDDELDDFHASIEDQGYDKDDFELTQSANPTRAGAVSAVTARSRSDGKARMSKEPIPAGHDSTWAGDLDDDLESGIFGNP
jgi:hypothetical protein